MWSTSRSTCRSNSWSDLTTLCDDEWHALLTRNADRVRAWLMSHCCLIGGQIVAGKNVEPQQVVDVLTAWAKAKNRTLKYTGVAS
jgi:hypothetical protein